MYELRICACFDEGGRREKLTQQQSHEIRVLMKDPAVKIANIARQYKVSRSTIYRVIANGDNTA
ncbi:helix-turn-helix domain-containing protein [uncultured Cardiobacterium sp.]|uniref:helix-turn-helix domain-containing protein n=1 Tax=uncultured Cardiobacterium sp. TaxID=417619 RepID=UPI00262C888D|nr:helix-turn-helix domain-containing protein [uncultured Cardiobacterium sp.]